MIQTPLVRLVDDDTVFCTSQKFLLQTRGWQVAVYNSARAFLEEDDRTRPGCILLDVRMPDMTGLELQLELEARGSTLPVIFLTGHGDISMAVHTMQHGAASFLEKPVEPIKLLETVANAVEADMAAYRQRLEVAENRAVFDQLTPREKEIIRFAALDTPNKVIAQKLGISEPTVKMHRANAFAKLRVKSALEAYRELQRMGITLD